MNNTVNEYVNYVNNIQSPSPYPEAGSSGIYMCYIVDKSRAISPTALRLFMVMACDINQYGQTNRTREELAKAISIKYSKSRMSTLIRELVENEFIAVFGKVFTINPFLVLPKVRNPRMKATIQEAWRDIIEFGASC